MRKSKLLRWWEERGHPRLLAIRRLQGVAVQLHYRDGLLTEATGEVADWAKQTAPQSLAFYGHQRPFNGTIFGRVLLRRNKLHLFATGYHLDSTRIKNEGARRRLLAALGFEVDEGKIIEVVEEIKKLRPIKTLLVDDVETRKIAGRSAVLT